MSQHAQNSEAVEVIAASLATDVERPRMAAATSGELIDLVRESVDPTAVTVTIDAAFPDSDIDDDEFVALASVLVHHGARAFITSRPQTLRRILAMHSVIEAGSIEVLG